MKIESSSSNGLSVGSRTSARAPAASKGPEGGADAVRLSNAASQLAQQGTPVNRSRVDEIRAAIAEGRFQINASAIADRLIDSARELVAAQGKAA